MAANATRRGTNSARIIRFADLLNRSPPPTVAAKSTNGFVAKASKDAAMR